MAQWQGAARRIVHDSNQTFHHCGRGHCCTTHSQQHSIEHMTAIMVWIQDVQLTACSLRCLDFYRTVTMQDANLK